MAAASGFLPRTISNTRGFLTVSMLTYCPGHAPGLFYARLTANSMFIRELSVMTAHPLVRYLALVLLLLCGLMLSSASFAQSAPRVELAPVNREPIYTETNLVGTVNSLEDALLSASVAGLIVQVAVNPGDHVSKGDTLIALDDDLARFDVAAAAAAEQEAQATLAEAERLLREAESVGVGRNIAATEASARRSAVNVARAARSRLTAEQARLSALLARHVINAPFDGVVSARSINLGEWVTPGDSVARLVNLNELRADFQVPETFYTAIQGETFITLRAGQQTYETTIATVVPISDPSARTFLLRAHVPEAASLYPGNAVDAVLRAPTNSDGLTVPRDALSRYPDGRVTVWVATPNENNTYHVTEQRVQLGISFADRVEIIEGLTGDEQVVIRGNESLVEGVSVEDITAGSE